MKRGSEAEFAKQHISYAKANNKYMNNYDKKIDSSDVEYLDANNLCGWALSQKLPIDGFKWGKNYRNLMKTS